ncbi:hypothetical protein MHK_010586 [Candidatus Magnetomorum sp. HK-1]|nr:hypothetical protein MHK_010586 [Candidatus Magnetomorum sp. HK-1]
MKYAFLIKLAFAYYNSWQIESVYTIAVRQSDLPVDLEVAADRNFEFSYFLLYFSKKSLQKLCMIVTSGDD